jgi:phage tail sheath protein FI
MDIFLHGFETQENDSGNPRFVATIDTGIIFLVGTAPSRVMALYPPNQLFAVFGYNDFPQGLGTTGTLVDGLVDIFSQAGRMSQTVVCNIVEAGANAAETLANIIGSQALRTGLYAVTRAQSELNLKPKMAMAPGFTSVRPTDGVASITISNAGTGYTQAPTVVLTNDTAATPDTTGTGATAYCTIGPDGKINNVFINTAGYKYTKPPKVSFVSVDGNGSGAAATTTLGVVANPVASVLNQLCNRLRMVCAVSGPNTNSPDAVQYRLDFNTDRLYVLDPFATFQKAGVPVQRPAEAAMLGLQARIDYEEGFWVSPSNHVLEGVLGTARPIEHSLYDRAAESQYLNKNHVGTIVRAPSGGWKLFGNRVANSDPLHVFWSVRRCHDTIIESIEIASEPFLDKPFSVQNLVDIAETTNKALRRWQALGATLGGRVWLDPTLNTAESLSSGITYVSYDAEGPAPMEHIVFVFNRNTGYYDTVFAGAATEIARSAAAAA